MVVVPLAYRTRYFCAGEIITDPVWVGPPNDDDCREAVKRRTVARRLAQLKANTIGPRHVFAEVAERDNYRCHLCGRPVDMTLPRTAPMGATVDHLIPVAHGGGDEAENVRLAHRRCNIKRSTGGTVQLLLVS